MATPSYRMINRQAHKSFVFKWEPFDLTTRWHYHPEIELIFFIEGKTTAVIGDGFQHFNEGEMVLLGPNFPHVLQEDKLFSAANPDCKPFGLIIQFTEDFLGSDFLAKPEMAGVAGLIKKSKRGLFYNKTDTQPFRSQLLDMHTLSEPKKLLRLLELLQDLSEKDVSEYMTQEDYRYDNVEDEERMRHIHQFIFDHFTEKISVRQMAAVANMTETSFCRYFKTRTLKNFTRYLNEVRISYACKLLSSTTHTVSSTCFESGFNELSYFTRQFKLIMKMTPKDYQKWKKGVQGQD